MKKRTLALLLAGLMTAALTSCGSSSTESSSSAASGESTAASSAASSEAASAESSEEASEEAVDYPALAIENRPDTTHLVVNYFTWVGSSDGVSRIQEKMNELTVPALNIDVELQVTDFASRSQQMTLAFAGGEQIDLYYSSGLGLTGSAQNDYCYDLEAEDEYGNSLIETYGQDIIDTMGWDNINTSRVDGVLYGTPTEHDLAQGRNSLAIRRTALQAAEAYMDLTPDYDTNIWQVNGQEDIVTILKALHDAEPTVTACHITTLATTGWTDIDNLGGNVFGVLLNYGQDLEVVNFFESQEYLDFVNMMTDLNQYGCISPDAMTDTTSDQGAYEAGTINSYVTSGKPDIVPVDSDIIVAQGGPNFTYSSQIGGFCWMMGYTTADPVAAMQYLDFMYASPEWNNLFMWGEEGVDYELNDEGLVVKNDDSDFGHVMQWLAPAEFIAHVQDGNPTDLWEQYIEFNNSAVVSKASGFTFSTAPVATQYTAVTNVYNQYQKLIEFGFASDPESSIAEMNAAMQAAGLQDIIDEKQAQLDAWLALKG
jgi:putative aldouronate transport system substrate-binding protein